MSDTGIDVGLDLETLFGDSDPENCAHILRRSEALGAHELRDAAAEAGVICRALCGFEWVPKGHPPEDLPVCRPCVSEWERLTS